MHSSRELTEWQAYFRLVAAEEQQRQALRTNRGAR